MPESTAKTFSDILRSMIPDEYRQVKTLSGHELALQQCQWYNDSQGKLIGYDCQECKNRGFFQVLDKDDNARMRECKCMNTRRYISAMQASGLGDLYERCTFDSYIVTSDFQQRCKDSAMKYVNQQGNGWFFFAGNSGAGKTHLCTAICSELAKQGRAVKYIQWKRLYDKLLQTKYKQNEQDVLFNDVICADVLYLDDFLKTPNNIAPNADMLSYALEIIDARDKAEKKTIISTEFMIDEIIGFDEALGGRIRERTLGNKCMVKREQGRNYRMRGTNAETKP